jgi:ABC-type transport system involved in multi-copper enzyme maturation permease subunit
MNDSQDSVINKALFKATIEEWRYNPAFLPLMVLGYLYLIGFAIISVSFVSAPIHEATFSSVFYTAAPCVALLGAGIIGQNVSSGILSVLFARPIRRYSYVLTRWLALAVASSTLCLILLLVEQVAGMAAFPGVAPDFNTLSQGVARVSMCFGLSATFIMFSSVLPSVINLSAWILFCIEHNCRNSTYGAIFVTHIVWKRARSQIGRICYSNLQRTGAASSINCFSIYRSFISGSYSIDKLVYGIYLFFQS